MNNNNPEKSTLNIITNNLPIDGLQNIGYKGQVTVKLTNGKTTLKTTTYKNSGMISLFKFLCNCLAGNYTDTLRPCKIKFFCYDNAFDLSEEYSPANFNWGAVFDGSSPAEEPYEVTPYIVYETTPVIKYVKEQRDPITNTTIPAHYETTFHFRVPFSMISGKSSENNTGTMIHMVGIFPNNATSNQEVSAYYLFTTKDEAGILQWDPIVLDGIVGNYSLILDWTMSVSNKAIN